MCPSRAHLSRAYVEDLTAAGVSYRNHRKITVIDGAIGYTGGMNIGRGASEWGEGLPILA